MQCTQENKILNDIEKIIHKFPKSTIQHQDKNYSYVSVVGAEI